MRDIISYHERTKHYPYRSARSLGYMDWATQPDPFRRYAGAPLHPLPLSRTAPEIAYAALYEPGGVAPNSLTLNTLGQFLGNALGLSAWKEYHGNRWELRCNPSSGNLHPTEGYCIAGPLEGLSEEAGVYHYAPKEHGLEGRAAISSVDWANLVGPFPDGTFFTGLASIHWREAWKYGERAWRYCQHDAGHGLAALSYSAAALGWRVVALDGTSDALIRRLLGLPSQAMEQDPEAEMPDMICAVVPADHTAALPAALPETQRIPEMWLGTPNQLSAEHVEWMVIDEVATACEKPVTVLPPYPAIEHTVLSPTPAGPTARQIFQQRRSAVAMDGETGISRETFYGMLARCMPEHGMPPWWSWPYAAEVHLALFVHRVDGLEPGIYLLQRNPDHAELLRSELNDAFLWESPQACPASLPLYLLARGDVRRLAAQLCCGQEIAGDGAFMAGMLARFAPVVEEPWRYRRLFWETGLIGQVLYLEAEAAGIRGTGIGCFFDDPVHEALGFSGNGFQSLYHFTVGGHVDDPRLRTLPPYPPERYEE